MAEDLYRSSVTDGLGEGGESRSVGGLGEVWRGWEGDAEWCDSRGGCRPGLRLTVGPGWVESRTRSGTAWEGGFFQTGWSSWCQGTRGFSQEDCAVHRSKKHSCSFLRRMNLLRMQWFKLLEGRYKAVPRPNESSSPFPTFEGARGSRRPGTSGDKKSLTTISLIQPIGAIFDPVTDWNAQAIH